MQITANVLPAGSVPPVAALEPGTHSLTIVSVRENDEMTVRYPDGWTRDHQAKDMAELAPKITNNLRARYGAHAVKIITAPATLAEGAVIEVEV